MEVRTSARRGSYYAASGSRSDDRGDNWRRNGVFDGCFIETCWFWTFFGNFSEKSRKKSKKPIDISQDVR